MKKPEYLSPQLLRLNVDAAEEVAKAFQTGEKTGTTLGGAMAGRGEKPFTVAS